MPESFEVGVVGAGYVGLVTGACLAHLGNYVTLLDANAERIENLKHAELPIHEPGLGQLMARSSGRMEFSTCLEPAAREADVLFIAVGTPPLQDGSADLSNVAAVARGIGWALSGAVRERPLVVVNKSTVPVGSGDYVSMLVREGAEEAGRGAAEFVVVSNPEFLREGGAIHDTLFPERIVLGTDSGEALELMRALYRPIIERSFPPPMDQTPKVAASPAASPAAVPVVALVSTDLASAEMIKYAANAFLATKISFINEVSNLCELVGADIKSVATGIGLDERIGARFLNAGIGWGGSCFPKDVAALEAVAAEYGYQTRVLSAAVKVNERQRQSVIDKLQQELRTLKGKRVALLGLSFKPDTDDLREAPSLHIARMLHARGARVVGHDPVAGKAASLLVPELRVTGDPYQALSGAHAAVLVTEWEEYGELDLARVASVMKEGAVLVDGRNLYEPGEVRGAGIRYRGFGRG